MVYAWPPVLPNSERDRALNITETALNKKRLVEIDVAEIRGAILAKVALAVGKEPERATTHDWYLAAVLTLRDRIVYRWLPSQREARRNGRKRVYYLSLEFLIGRLFTDALNNMELMATFEKALRDLGIDLKELKAVEPDAALGNGGLGRLAACFMESLASLSIPAQGYGIRYEHGLFKQRISQGWQQEFPETWLESGNPWEFERFDVTYDIHYGGYLTHETRPSGEVRVRWVPGEKIKAAAYDTPIVGWHGEHINALRLWAARSEEPLHLETFNRGDHAGAVAQLARAEAISKFLYPSDETAAGKELRLRQEYFFVSASLQDIIDYHLRSEGNVRTLASRAAIQLNDTHPSLAVPELIRLLLDKYDLSWENARDITEKTISYTNHTLLPEALETWPVELFERLLPRHLDIIYRLNIDNLAVAEKHAPGDVRFLASTSLIDENAGRRVRMGHLAFIGSHRINGVSAMHSELMKDTVFADLNALYPGRITNKTNGITFRRWLHQCNPSLTRLLRDVCGERVLDDPAAALALERFASDVSLQEQFTRIKRKNKSVLADEIARSLGIKVDSHAMFDIQIKRIHEYKRQLMNALDTIARYQAIRDNPHRDWVPKVKIFGGKAAPGYHQAKLIIKLINDIAAVVNNDTSIRGLLKVAFVPNYNVSAAEMMVPACDLSEQISTAGMEASGTGNMKLALNGALTIGTLDGANIEIRDHVGDANLFIFGMNAAEVTQRRQSGLDATDVIANSPVLKRVIDALDQGEFSPDDPARFAPVAHSLRYLDYYLVSSDFDDYHRTQALADACWTTDKWVASSILNTARMGWFSADRTIRDYADDVWGV
ncbi:MAG: glycogen/starch/alpha-glucan phosphorylase [Xanthobacteraceae bacterium]|nr:glycogen/starch/alpha-glucan phosphorylase [Xanthobacteraceae bacterium]